MKRNIIPVMLLLVIMCHQLTGQTPRTEFTIELSANKLVIKPGETKTVEVKISRSKGYSKSKAVFGLSSSLPEGIILRFKQPEDLLQNTPAIITVSEKVKHGTYMLLLNCKINNKSKGTTLKLIVGGTAEVVTKLD